jgi:hypothetical protein
MDASTAKTDLTKRVGIILGAIAVTWGLFIFVAVAAGFLYSLVINPPKIARVQKVLEGEYSKITPPPESERLDFRSRASDVMAFVETTYKSPLSSAQIREHYGRKLLRNGWVLHSDKKLLDWNRDFGGRSITYCKGQDEASVDYAGPNAHYGWDIAFAMT